MKQLRILVVALVAIIAAGCNNISDPVSIGPSVSGQVLDALNNTPVDGATITIGGRMGASGLNGAYFIADVPKGSQVLKVTKSGYADYIAEVNVDEGIFNKTIHLTR